MIDIDALQFQKLDLAALRELTAMAVEEGWNTGRHDVDAYYAADPEGFYGFFHNGELIAGGAIVSYGGEFGFMGFFIVRPEYRGHGIGRKLWYLRRDKLLSRLKPGAAIGMDGVVPMQPFYQKGGFRVSFRDKRYEILGKPTDVAENISTIKANDFDAIMEFDRECFGFSRPQFMEKWLQIPESHAFKCTAGNRLDGFAVIRKVARGYKIGPLFARTPSSADELYRACLNAVPGSPVYLDVPTRNTAAVSLMKTYNARYVYECARMYLGEEPKVAWGQVYGITTFELG